jgi:hypothetical protein
MKTCFWGGSFTALFFGRISGAFFKAPETGLSAPIFFAGDGKKVFPLLSLAQ